MLLPPLQVAPHLAHREPATGPTLSGLQQHRGSENGWRWVWASIQVPKGGVLKMNPDRGGAGEEHGVCSLFVPKLVNRPRL